MASCEKCGCSLRTSFFANTVALKGKTYCKTCAGEIKAKEAKEKADIEAKEAKAKIEARKKIDLLLRISEAKEYARKDSEAKETKAKIEEIEKYEYKTKSACEILRTIFKECSVDSPFDASAENKAIVEKKILSTLMAVIKILQDNWEQAVTDTHETYEELMSLWEEYEKKEPVTDTQKSLKHKVNEIKVYRDWLLFGLGITRNIDKNVEELSNFCKEYPSEIQENLNKYVRMKHTGYSLVNNTCRERVQELHSAFSSNSEVLGKVFSGELFVGMPHELLIEHRGSPLEKKQTVFKSKIKDRYFYDAEESSRGTIKYKLEVMLEDDVVVGWKEN